MLLPIYKPLGKSSHQLAKRAGEQVGEPATHTGTLDPMAEGVLVVLTGEDRFHKQAYGDWPKTYQFQVLCGVETDSGDLLGLARESFTKPISIQTKALEKRLQKLVGSHYQTLPTFSARRLDGESYFDKAKRGEVFAPDQEKITIYSLELNAIETIDLTSLEQYLSQTINQVEGDFRQSGILKLWQQQLIKLKKNKLTSLPLITFTATVSKRTYIRSLVQDIFKPLAIPATTFHILRTHNGPHQVKNCLCLI